MPDQDIIAPPLRAEFVSLVAGDQSFCIEITLIREIRRWTPVTILPHAPDFVLGVINLRGAVIPIVDLAAKLGFPPAVPTPRHVIIVTALGDRTVGLLVSSVSEILSVDAADIRETPRIRDDETNRAISGVIARGEDMTRIIDLRALLPPGKDRAA